MEFLAWVTKISFIFTKISFIFAKKMNGFQKKSVILQNTVISLKPVTFFLIKSS